VYCQSAARSVWQQQLSEAAGRFQRSSGELASLWAKAWDPDFLGPRMRRLVNLLLHSHTLQGCVCLAWSGGR
jgi:hypothetical protein